MSVKEFSREQIALMRFVGPRVRARLMQAGLTADGFDRKLGWPVGTTRHLYLGACLPTTKRLAELAAGLETPAAYFLPTVFSKQRRSAAKAPSPSRPLTCAEHVAFVVKEQRTRLGLTQRQVGERVGVTAQAIERIENTGITPRLHRYPALARALRLSVRDLFPPGYLGDAPATRGARS